LVGGDISVNVPTNIRGGNVVEYELKTAGIKNVCKCRIKKRASPMRNPYRACAQQA